MTKMLKMSNLKPSTVQLQGAPLLVMERSPPQEVTNLPTAHVGGDFKMEDSPSYEILQKHDMLTSKYRVWNEKELTMIGANSTRLWNALSCLFCCPFAECVIKSFEVPNGCVKMGEDGRGNYVFFGAGVHQVVDPFYTVHGANVSYAMENIVHGDRSIVTVPQGFIGYCTDRGQPVLLPPGMHQWQSPTLKFQKIIDLNDHVIKLGPWTLLTIDEGYMAVTQDNGKQIILDGGAVYLLTHRNWKFEKFVSTKIQTNELKRNEAASADNVIMLVDATVLWRIYDVETAVRMSAETMSPDGQAAKQGQDILKLRNDVLKQAEASLSFFIGTINFSDTMAAAASCQRPGNQQASSPSAKVQVVGAVATTDDVESRDLLDTQNDIRGNEAAPEEVFNLYDNDKLRDAVTHANEITRTYGVEIISINIISAIPSDAKLQESLAAGAVAAAEAQMMETAAVGKSRAVQIEAAATAKQTMIIAQAEADADIVRAKGSKDAADLLSANPVSVELAKIERTGDAIAGKGNHASFFFGAQPENLSNLLANPNVISGGNDWMQLGLRNQNKTQEERG